MTKLFLISAAIVAISTSAQAGCGTKALNGTWILQGVDDASYNEFIIQDGVVTGVGTVSQSKTSCRVTMVLGGITVKGRTENVSGTSRKPHIMTLYNEASGEAGVVVRK